MIVCVHVLWIMFHWNHSLHLFELFLHGTASYVAQAMPKCTRPIHETCLHV